jgi:hypothetical protein
VSYGLVKRSLWNLSWKLLGRSKRVGVESQKVNRCCRNIDTATCFKLGFKFGNSSVKDYCTCLKATGRPERMETVAKLPLPIDTSFHSGLISCEDMLSINGDVGIFDPTRSRQRARFI